jgi:hypothetical protein
MKTISTVLVFLAKSFAFSLVFAVTVAMAYWLLVDFTGRTTDDAKSRAQSAAYDKQLQDAARQMAMSEALQQRAEKLLAAQEDHVRRFGAVLEQWERQTSLRK